MNLIEKPLLAASLVLLLCLGTISILVFKNGYVSPDSSNYLAAARNIIDGHGPTIINEEGDAERELFAVWPMGYPLLISAISVPLNEDVYVASKVLTVILLLLEIVVVYALFRHKLKPLSYVIFLLPSSIMIHAFSWSEQTFLLSLLLAALGIKLAHLGSKRSAFITLTAACILCFSARYIGLFLPAAILAFSFVRFQGVRLIDPKNRRPIFAAATLGFIFDFAYLWMNVRATGQATGVARVPASEGFFVLTQSFVSSIGKDMLFFIPIVCLLVFQIFKKLKIERAKDWENETVTAAALIFIGCFYLLGIYALRSVSFFDLFNPRLTFPGTCLLLLGVVQITRLKKPILTYSVAIGTILFLGVWTSREYERGGALNAHEKTELVMQNYRDLPRDSIVLLPRDGEYMLATPQRYLRPDLILIFPNHPPYHPSEDLAGFEARMARIAKNHPNSETYVDFGEFKSIDRLRAAFSQWKIDPEIETLLEEKFVPGRLIRADFKAFR